MLGGKYRQTDIRGSRTARTTVEASERVLMVAMHHQLQIECENRQSWFALKNGTAPCEVYVVE
jgi:hypothetical protein